MQIKSNNFVNEFTGNKTYEVIVVEGNNQAKIFSGDKLELAIKAESTAKQMIEENKMSFVNGQLTY